MLAGGQLQPQDLNAIGQEAPQRVSADSLASQTTQSAMIDAAGPFLLDVQVPYQEHVLPMIPAGMTVPQSDQGIVSASWIASNPFPPLTRPHRAPQAANRIPAAAIRILIRR